MKTLKFLGSMVAPVSFMLLSSTVQASAPDGVEFRSVSYNGRGCPRGTVIKSISPDSKAFTLAFSEYVAEVGRGIARSESYKNCVVTVDLDFPGGWQWAVTKFDYRGFAALDDDVKGTQKTRYWFQGYDHGSAQSTLTGPYDDDYHFTDYVSTITWSPCGATRALNINSDIRLNNRDNRRGTGFMTLDSLDGSVAWEFGIQWRRCR